MEAKHLRPITTVLPHSWSMGNPQNSRINSRFCPLPSHQRKLISYQWMLGPEDFISKLFLSYFVWKARNILEKKLKPPKLTNNSTVQPFLLAWLWYIICSLVTNHIACCANWPMRSALARAGVYMRADLIGHGTIISFKVHGIISKGTTR